MTPELTPELQQALDEAASPCVVDPRTNKTYYLVAADQYERIQALLEPIDTLSDTYPAQLESAMKAGWGDPAMDDYDRYDELRPTA
jgi:hypothetical protein